MATGGTYEEPVIYWKGLNGLQNVSTSSNLNFNPLMASQAGTYFCHASLGSSEGKESISIFAECIMRTIICINIICIIYI